MAKDDYYVIVYKILLYYYACLKRKIFFDEFTLNKILEKNNINEEYLIEILYMMKKENLIDNVTVIKAWGNSLILTSELKDIKITSTGINYLEENNKLKKVKDFLLSKIDIVSELIKLVF